MFELVSKKQVVKSAPLVRNTVPVGLKIKNLVLLELATRFYFQTLIHKCSIIFRLKYMFSYLTTTGSFSRGSPLSGKWTAITIMEPSVVPTYKHAFK